MLSFEERKRNAQKFADEWRGKGNEKEHDQTFWNQLLAEVLGVERVHHEIEHQKPVKIKKSTKWLDAYIASSKVLIEQKSIGIDLRKSGKQSDGEELSPYEQAVRYAAYLPVGDTPEFIITSNFESFLIYDRRNDPDGQNPVEVSLEELPSQLPVFDFITDPINAIIEKSTQVSKEAAQLIGSIYDEIRAQYIDPDKSHGALAALMVRILFCLYAEDSGLFEKSAFYNYLKEIPARQGFFRDALMKLFKVLDTPKVSRDTYIGEMLSGFPYVNGGLFAEDIEIPIFTDTIKHKLLDETSHHFDWSKISPVIFGSIFESILSGEERRAGGMHYTSVANIRKLIDPLFLDDIVSKLYAAGNDKDKLRLLQDEISTLTFLDPAMGSGNFLTQTLIELRKIENEILKRLAGDVQLSMALDDLTVKVNVGQFYGIEINEFAVAVANTALWIAEHQANVESSNIIHRNVETLPLIDYNHLHQGNALRMDWEQVISQEQMNYILGNPPFVGYSLQAPEQKEDMLSIYVDSAGKPYKTAGKIDYVAAWYYKAAQYMVNASKPIQTAFVSTNSIVQGEQVAAVWKPLYELFGIEIDFAYRTFRWDNESKGQAAVHCVIVGFSKDGSRNRSGMTVHEADNTVIPGLSRNPKESNKTIYEADGTIIAAENINPYLVDAPIVFIESRNKPLCEVPNMITGNRPADGGHLIIEDEDLQEFIQSDLASKKYIKRLVGSAEFINNIKRWCLWLVDVPPNELRQMPMVMKRIEACLIDRQNSPDAGRRKLAETPMLFRETRNPDSYIVIPSVSSERRKYVPIGLLDGDTIATNLVLTIPNATLYHFGILTSNVHNSWMRAVCGRLEMRYRYSKDIVYNNFPWPETTEEQSGQISTLAQTILDTRDMFLNSSLADLYDPLTMPPELTKAHRALDSAVIKLYGGEHWESEADCVADLMQRYKELTEDE